MVIVIVTCTYGRLLDDRVSTKYYICMLRTPDSGHIGSSLGFTNGEVNSYFYNTNANTNSNSSNNSNTSNNNNNNNTCI